WSSISLTSFRASSTGWTFVRNARSNTPSKSDSSFDSIVRNTDIAESPEPFRRVGSLRGRLEDQRPRDEPGDDDERQDGGGRSEQGRRREEPSPVPDGRPRPAPPNVGQHDRGRRQANSFGDQ